MFTLSAFSGSDTHAGFTHRPAEPVTASQSHPVDLSASKAQCAFPMSMAESGMTVRVTALRGSGMDRRMTEMGLNVGAEIRVVQHQGGGLVVQRGESRYALGAGLAHRVMVVPV